VNPGSWPSFSTRQIAMFREALDESQKTREDARNLMLLEWAKELLLEETEL
jgi:hypothetical protein